MNQRDAEDRAITLFSPQNGEPDQHHPAALGEKGRRLFTMASLGAPVPPGLVLTSGWGPSFNGWASNGSVSNGGTSNSGASNGWASNGGKGKARGWDEALGKALDSALSRLAEHTGRTFGDDGNPLLLALRASPPAGLTRTHSMMPNLGLTEKGVVGLIGQGMDEGVAWDAYRRQVASYAVEVLDVAPEELEEIRSAALDEAGVEAEHELDPPALRQLALTLRAHCEETTGNPWPTEPMAQLREAIGAGFSSWYSPKAEDERWQKNAHHHRGTALVLQQMAWGTGTDRSGAGRFSTRVPATGEAQPHGYYLERALGPDLTAGIRMTDPVVKLEKNQPEAWAQLLDWCARLEGEFKDAQELHFVLDEGTMHLLSCRPAPRSAKASLRIALELEEAGVVDAARALCLVNPNVVDEFLHPVLDKAQAPPVLVKGLPASPGSAVGEVVFFAEHAVELAAQGIKTILVRHETTPEDIDGLKVAEGIVTAHGGMTSHAAVVARGMGKCCIVGAKSLHINYLVNEMNVGEQVVKRRDKISIDGNTGEIYVGELPQVQPALEGGIAKVLEWADAYRTLGVYANADTAEDAARAVEKGAGGIGLCRTEHMFFEMDRITLFRKMILAMDEVGRSAALSELLPHQRRDFMNIFRVMGDRPVTIRLLDPPLNEFLPRGIRSQTRMSRAMGIPVEAIQTRIDNLTENNPMMGHRGCRLAVTYPEIYQMQVRAIVEAACIVKKEGVQVHPEIMVPLVSTSRELVMIRGQIEELVKTVNEEMSESIPIKVGTMVETPRAAVCSAAIARYADFYSFGTNDLTQMAYGFSRDDVGMFLPEYLDKGILDNDPFTELDQSGTGRLVQMAVKEGREVNPDIKMGICGEHGGEPNSVKFFHRAGLDYVSCSPFRIPVARLAAGQAAVEEKDV